jgi:hypothetical protein
MGEDTSLIKVDLTKAATVLIEKISDAIGGYFKPFQIRRVAKAEAEAEIIRTEAQIECEELQRRALARFIAEEAKKQDNIESITRKAIPLLSDSSNPEKMEDDWITNFFDKCRIISDDEMQVLWSKVLAGEANSPGSFSKRTVNSLASLDKEDAQSFTSLCGFAWEIGHLFPLIFDYQASIYIDHGVNFGTLSHLDDVGLISFQSAGLRRTKLPRAVVITYYGTPLNIEFKKSADNELNIGMAIFTKTGHQLAGICGAKQIDGFFHYVVEKWTKEGLTLSSPLPRKK